MEKVGTVTLHYPYNYGSTLQAFALQKVLEQMGYESEIIDYICMYDFENYKLFRIHQYKNRPKTFLSDILYLKKNLKRRHSFRKFHKKYLKITSKKYNSIEELKSLNTEMDAFVAGSDQIWNFECTGGVDSVYFLDFVSSSKKKIAYAPSMGQNGQNQKDLDTIKPMLESFNSLSIREKSMEKKLESLTNRDFEVVLDPTLLLKSDDYSTLLNKDNDGKYIFVYLLEPNNELVDYVSKLAKEKELKVLYISNITKKKIFDSVNSENLYGLAPNEFLSKLKNAEYVVTNSFHATVFSIIFEKRFATFKTRKSFPRMLDLLGNLGLTNRIMDSNFNMDDQIDFKTVNKKLELLKQNSINFLKSALSKND